MIALFIASDVEVSVHMCNDANREQPVWFSWLDSYFGDQNLRAALSRQSICIS